MADFARLAGAENSAESPVHRFIESISNASKPLVAAVQGNAVGIGTTMLLHYDLVYLADNARLITPFVKLALVPEAASSWLLLALHLDLHEADPVHTRSARIRAN